MVTISVENGNAGSKKGNVLVKRGNYSVWSCDGITTDRTGRVLVKHGNYLLHGMAFHVLIDGLSHDVADGSALSGKVLHAVQLLVGGEWNACLDVLHRFRGHGRENGWTLISRRRYNGSGFHSGKTAGHSGSFGVELRHHGFMFLDGRGAGDYAFFE